MKLVHGGCGKIMCSVSSARVCGFVGAKSCKVQSSGHRRENKILTKRKIKQNGANLMEVKNNVKQGSK